MKKFLAVLLAVTMILSFAACNNGGSSSTGGNNNSDSSQGESKGGLDMKFWIFIDPTSTEDPRSLVLKEIVDDYNANNKYGNTVTVESIHWSKFESQAIQAAASGTGPDIINAFSDQLRMHIEGGTVQPMTQYAKDFIAEMPDYIHTAEKLTQPDGEIYSLPWESRVTVMWYRNDVYDSAPKSLDDLLKKGSAATQDLALGFALGLGEGSNATGLMETFIPLIRSAGGDLLDADGKAIFNSDAGVKVVEYIKSLVDQGSMDQTTMSMTYDDIVDAFKGGTILGMNAGTQRAATIMTSDLADKFSSAPIPGFTEGESAPAFVAGQTLAIGKYAQDPEMAFDFIKTFYTVENQKKWVGANCLPVRTDVYNDAEIQAMDTFEDMEMWSEYATTGTMVFFPEDYSELSVKLAQAVQTVVFQGADAKTALDEAANWYNSK